MDRAGTRSAAVIAVLAIAAGTGTEAARPITVMTMAGTHSTCSALLIGWRWLAPYSANHWSTLRMV